MNSAIIPPSPSWYLSSILAYNDDGLLAYGSRNEITFFHLNLNEGQSSVYECTFLQHAHTERINCLVFSPNFGSFKNCIASCSDDGLVKIWDVTTHELRLNHSGHKDSLKILGLDWSLADPNLVVSVNDQGNIVCFDLPSNTIRRLNAGYRIFPLCLASCPHNKDIIAIGAKTGIIVIINIKGDGKELFRVKGHEADVVSLSWCPVPNDVFSWDNNKKQNQKTLLLASGGCDKCIYIWKAGVDMRYSSKLLLPIQPMGQTFKRKLPTAESTNSGFICVRWVDPYQILSSSMFGELLSWDVRKIVSIEKSHKSEKKKTSKMVQPRILHSAHTKGLFSIACQISSKRNIESKEDNRIAYTTAVDRHLTLCNIGSGEIILDVPCAGNIIYCIVTSPNDPNRLAIGTGDGKILIWDMGTKVLFKDVYLHWRKINGKVMALAWHPTDSDIIAFGTGDGRIGLFEVGTDKFPTIFKLYHHRAVYTLVWAPPIILSAKNKQTNLALFSVGDKELVQYCRETPDKDPVSLEKQLKDADIAGGMRPSQRTDIAFKYDLSVFAVANDNGSVHILSCEDQSRLHTLYPHKKGINSLVWHPPSVYSDANSPYKNWLASGAENIKVFNIPDQKDLPVETIASFTLHIEKIASLAWNSHFNAQLMSASYDGTVQVWDILTQAPIATYQKHNSAVLCAIWSPLDPDLAISGSYDNTLQVWHVSKQTIATPGKKKLRMANISKARLAIPLATELSMNKNPSSSKTSFCIEDYNKRVRARSFFPVTSFVLQNPKHFNLLYKRVLQSEQESSYDSSMSEEKILTNSVKDIELGDSEPDSLESTAYLDYFGDKKAMRRLLLLEDTHLQGTGYYFHSQLNALWRGDISQMLEEATKKKQLSDWLVSISTMCSFAVWAETCVAYASQLTDCGEYVKASSYLLAIHKVEEAILLLAENNLFKEALAIAKSRYPEDDPTITMVLQKWGQYSSSNGQLLLAAHCFLAIRDYHSASEVLVRCNDLKSLKLAAVMAEKAGSLELAKTLMKDCLQIGLQHANYIIVEDIIAEKSEYQAWSLWLEACHIVNFMKKNKKNCEEHQLSWLRKECTAESILDKMKPVCEKVGEEYIHLNKYVAKLKMPSSDKELWYIMSGHIAILCAAYHNTGRINSTTLQSFVSALSTAYQFQTTYDLGTPLLQLCYFFSPRGPFSSNSIFMSSCETEEEKLLMKSARAFLCAGIIHWLTNSKSIKETIFNKIDDENENSEAKETSREVSDIEELDWLVELLEKWQGDVLDAESFCFFKTKTQKQLLLDTAARDKAEKNKVKRTKENKMNSQGGHSMESSVKNLSENDNEDVVECDDEKINDVEEEKKDQDSENMLDNNTSKNKDILVEENGTGDIGSKLNKNQSKASTLYLVENGSGDRILVHSKETDQQRKKNTAPTENFSDNMILPKESIKPKTDNQETSPENGSDDKILVNATESNPQSGKTTLLKENGSDDIILQKESIKLKVENTEACAVKDNDDCGLISKVKRSICKAVIIVPESNKSTNPDVFKLGYNPQEDSEQIKENGKDQINNSVSEPKDEQMKENINLNNLEGGKNSNTNEELEKMDSFLNKFYESRVSAPNPFVACSNIKYVINCYVKELSPDLAKELDEKCDNFFNLFGKIPLEFDNLVSKKNLSS